MRADPMRAILFTLAATAALMAGCSKPAPKAESADASGAPASAAAPAAPAAPAAAPSGPAGPITLAELPAPTAGLWKRVSSQDGEAATTDNKCLTGKPIDPTEGLPGKCAKMDAQRTAKGGFVVDADCPANGVEAKLHLAGEGDFKSSYTTDASMSMSGGGGPPMTLKNHSIWTYVGPTCPKA
jgi:hypothetical protein